MRRRWRRERFEQRPGQSGAGIPDLDRHQLVGRAVVVTQPAWVTGGRWYSGFMKKTSIYLDPDVDSALDRRASMEGTTKAALIRGALAEAAAPAMRPRPRARGVFSGPGDLARNVDRYLAESGFGER
jgi:hypothetical protein